MATDVCFIVGALLAVFGFYLIAPWVACVVAGSLLMAVSAAMVGRNISQR